MTVLCLSLEVNDRLAICKILLGVYNQGEIPFPVTNLNDVKTGFALVVDCTMFSSKSISKTGSFTRFYWECTTKVKFHILFPI